MGRVFIPGIGFRDAALRLAAPASARSGDGRELTVRSFISGADGSDVVYEVETRPGDDRTFGGPDRVILHGASTDPACRPGKMNIAVREGKLVHSHTLPPVAAGVTRVELEVAGAAGEWRVPLDLEPFGDEGQRVADVGATDARGGIAITVRHLAITPDATIVDVGVAVEGLGRLEGIGGLHGMRDASTAMSLRDARGRTYAERTRNDARDSMAEHDGDVAVFDPLPDDAGDLVLDVPYVCIADRAARADIPLPVTSPVDVAFGTCAIRVHGASVADVETPWRRGPALQLELDLGGWQRDRRVLKPLEAVVDGERAGVSLGSGMRGPAPEPATRVLVPCASAAEARAVTLAGATLQVRGPWRIAIARP